MADIALKDDATREDVDALVKQYMQDRREPEKEKASSQSDTSKQTTAGDEQDSAGDDAAAGQKEPGGEESGKKSEPSEGQTWLTDEIRAELPRWVSDEDLSEFSTRDELERALSLMDRAAMKAGREAGRQGDDDDDDGQDDENPERGQDGKFVKQENRGDQKDDASQYEIDLDLSEFDEDLGKKVKDALTGLRDHYEGHLKALDERFSAIEAESQLRIAEAHEARFDAIVDSLGHADLFGKAGQENEKQLEARRKLFDEHQIYMAGLKSLGRESEMDHASVDRACRLAFADHISKQERKSLTKQLTKQSNMRMGVGAERPAEQPFKGPLKHHPDVVRAYKALQESRGED